MIKKSIHEAKVIRQLEHFFATGELSSLPLTLFNQNGKWMGTRHFSDREAFPKELTQKLSKLKVPKAVLVRTDDKGKHLQCSFYDAASRGPITIDYTSIIGDISVFSSSEDFYAPNLSEVKGDVVIMSDNVDMPNLCRVHGSLILEFVKSLNVPKLTSTNSDFQCPHVKELNAPKLRVVRGNLIVSDATSVHVPNLTSTKGGFVAFSATTIFAPKMKKVGGNLLTVSARDFYLPKSQVGHLWKLHPDAKRLLARKLLKGTGPPPEMPL